MRLPVIHLLFACTLLTACAVTSKNWQSHDTPGIFNATFGYFNGKESHDVAMHKDDVLFVDYALSASQGAVTLSVLHNRQVLWQKQVTSQGDTAGFHLTAPETGQYNIVVSGAKGAGAFAINYSVTQPKKVQVVTKRNIELYGLMMVLDDGPDVLRQKDTMLFDGRRAVSAQWYAVVPRNYEKYKRLDTCRIMTMYRKMETEGYFYDFFVGFLLQVDDVPFARLNNNTGKQLIARFAPKGDTAEARQKATDFLNALNDFCRAADFDGYLADNKQYYDVAQATVEHNTPAGDFLPTMEHYYRKQFNQYTLVPSLNVFTGMGFGILNHSTRSIYNAFGPFSFQNYDAAHPDMGFDYPEKIRALAVHEFGHSFANPAIDSLPASLLEQTAYLYEPIKEPMKKQAYTAWVMSLYEHLVRAGEVIVAEKIGDSARAVKSMQDNVNNGFIYLPFMVQELKKWDKNPAGVSFNEAVLQMMLKLKETYPGITK